jgi:group II intron reverse transcriptase/maturase
MKRISEIRKGQGYKGDPRSAKDSSREVGWGRSIEDREASKTSQEKRAPALTRIYTDEEGPVTAKGQGPLAQRTQRKVQVLQNKLHQAAKKDLNRTFGILYDKITIWEVLWVSWIRVQRNKGAPGVDGRTIEAIKKDGEVKFLRDIQSELLEKKYRPQPIKRVFIKKANGKLRPLGIPIVKDRVVQGAVKLILEPIFEANFGEESYGFRPKRSCKDALGSIRKWVTFGYSTVIDADISAYFDTIDHDLLLKLVQRRVRDPWILRLIRRWLKCSIFEQDKSMRAELGTPQGGVLSPLLANIYLHPLDKFWSERFPETKLVRYADDFVVLIRNRRPDRYFNELQEFIKKLKLQLSLEKTKVVNANDGFDFLGARLVLKPTRKDKRKKFCYTFPSPKSMNSVREKIRTEIGRDYDKSLKSKIEYLNPILRGWSNYFCWMNSSEHFHKIGRYSIQRLNGWNRRKQKRVRRSYRRLSGKDLEEMGLFAMHGRIRPMK